MAIFPYDICFENTLKNYFSDFAGGPVVKSAGRPVGGLDLITVWGRSHVLHGGAKKKLFQNILYMDVVQFSHDPILLCPLILMLSITLCCAALNRNLHQHL